MAKTMAEIKNGAVVNLLWCADTQPQTHTLAQVGELSVAVGDTYDGADFYRGGKKLLSPREQLIAELDEEVVNLTYENTLLLLELK